MKKQKWIFLCLFLVFVVIRLPGLALPYHQDEFKTAWALKSGGSLSGLHHPPLTQIFMNLDGTLFGADNLRVLPFLFSILSFIMLFFVMKQRAGDRAAIFVLGLFAISSYSVLSSLMVDTDGAILPLFFLLAVYFYDRLKVSRQGKPWLWLMLALALGAGFLVKLSFIIAIGAIILDFILDKYKSMSKKEVVYSFSALLGFFGFSILCLYIISYIYPVFSINSMVLHAASYAHFGGRNYFQSMIQGVKSLFYLSPLLLVPLLFINTEIWRKTRVFCLYLILGFIFYFILFDFSQGALDKYLMFAIVPFAVISGVILADLIEAGVWRQKALILSGAVCLPLLFSLNFLSHDVIGLYPKGEWFFRVFHLKWQMLNPFTGGDGPLGFYVSFLFLCVSFLLSIAVAFFAILKKQWKSTALLLIVFIGIIYNGVFIEEILWGKINGSAPDVLYSTIEFIRYSPAITKVLTYNDSGAYELNVLGKYAGRFYAAPQYEEGHRELFSQYEGQYLIIDIPHLYQTGFYGEYFSKCKKIFTTRSGEIFGYVFSCPRAEGKNVGQNMLK